MKLLFIEDGSVDTDFLEKFINKNLKGQLKIVVYRQGAEKPYILDIKNDLEDLHTEIIQTSISSINCGQLCYTIGATKLKNIFEKNRKEK